MAAMLGHERSRLRPGLVIVADKGFAGQDLEQLVGGHGRSCCAPIGQMSRADMGRWVAGVSGREHLRHPQRPARPGTPRRPHPGRSLGAGGATAARLAAAIWWNWEIGAPTKRSLIAYDH